MGSSASCCHKKGALAISEPHPRPPQPQPHSTTIQAHKHDHQHEYHKYNHHQFNQFSHNEERLIQNNFHSTQKASFRTSSPTHPPPHSPHNGVPLEFLTNDWPDEETNSSVDDEFNLQNYPVPVPVPALNDTPTGTWNGAGTPLALTDYSHNPEKGFADDQREMNKQLLRDDTEATMAGE
eukprot:GHVN01039550.1.p1 GENE.GHVN01039550.1~~GHVN01039550.1.p1  ORF type:complete len:180 (-),score=64.51 GHVN01039550.1:494-1033(-)